MKSFFFLFLFACLNANATSYFKVGQKDFTFQDNKRNRKIVTHVWYPAPPNIKMSAQEAMGPFLPVIAAMNAPLAHVSQKLPIVLISHGSGGKAEKLFWLTEYLVKNGVFVMGVDHPGNMTGDNS